MLAIADLGTLGNMLAYVVLSKELRPSSTAVLLKSLAVADTAVLLINAWMNSMSVLGAYYDDLGLRISGKVSYRYVATISWFCKTIAVYLVVFVSIERYIAVCKPLKAASICTVRKARISVGCLVIFSFGYNIPKLWYAGTLDSVWEKCPEEKKSNFLDSQYFYFIYVIGLYYLILFIIPVAVMMFSSVNLIKALRRRNLIGNDECRKLADNLTVRIVTVVTCFILLELPAIMINLLYTLNLHFSFMDKTCLNGSLIFSYSLGSFNSFINFYLYVLTGKNFRLTAIKLFKCRRKDSWSVSVKGKPRTGGQVVRLSSRVENVEGEVGQANTAYASP
jgi:hypothetical protein